MRKITIYQFTDPTCVWSWGNEPELRAIEYLYGDKVQIRFITGGLVEDITTLFSFFQYLISQNEEMAKKIEEARKNALRAFVESKDKQN